ncbi:nesprin-2 isoform X3 [Paralichthys olivaceus]|uniref:nesprin-2 isoform X3 n=1 Tax=Paralichthys olivaceus TaxID=8255 RepID=UPI003752D8A4
MSGDLESDRHGDDMEPSLNLSEFLFTSSLLETSLGDAQEVADGRSRDADVQSCGRLERRWILWHEFMKEHAHLDAWLRLAEQAVTSPNFAPVTYSAAKEDLRTFERLRCEAGSQLVQLDSLTHRNRTLTRLFKGAMRARLLASARECGQRWDDVNAKLETVTARLKSFQQCVCENSGRVNALLQRGEVLIQRSEPTDAQQIERRLLELLRHCSHVYNNIARTHTRLLSMRLVFEDEWILATDSGCPSESLLEDEGAPDNSHLDAPVVSNHPKVIGQSANPTLTFPSDPPSPVHHPPPPPSPNHEHLGLEWDPSVDIGRSVSCDDRDSSYFSVSTGDVLKRWSFFSSRSCQSDISNDITNQEEDLRLGRLDHTHPAVFSPAATQEEEPRLSDDQWATSTPDERNNDPVSFDGGRVRAWLGVQSPTPPERRTSCSKAVQTDEAEEESSCCEEAEQNSSKQRVTSSGASSSPTLLFLLLAAALALLACLTWVVQDSPCHRSDRMRRSFHVALRYVNGPPPT